MAPDLRAKALGYLRGGRVSVHSARRHPAGPLRPSEVLAHVRGHTALHAVTLLNGDRPDTADWRCSTCKTSGCAHVAAVQLVTGWPSAAAKTPTE